MLRTSLLLALLAGAVHAQDITVSQIGVNGANEDYIYHGMDGGIRAYSMATTSCNVGMVDVSWNDANKTAPLIGTNLYRQTSEGRFEQLGYGFTKFAHCGFDATGGGCPRPCTPDNDCDWLTPGCSDTYSSKQNDGQKGGGRWEVDPATGAWPPGTPTGPTGPPAIAGRIQVHDAELQDPGALYFAEAQYLSLHDQGAGNVRNNWGWRPIEFDSAVDIDNLGTTQPGDPVVYAWQAHADGVLVDEVPVVDEGGPGMHGWLFVASRAVDLGGGLWRYQYAVQNGNSGRAVGGFALPLPCDGPTVTDLYFEKPEYHSGSPYDNRPWSASSTGDALAWRTTDHAVDPDAAAIRWGMLYTFAFTTDRRPTTGQAELALFVPGAPASLAAQAVVPSARFPEYCTANPNSTGVPASITGLGSADVADGDLRFEVGDLPMDVFGYLLMSQSTTFVPNFGGSSGNLCVGPPQVRFTQDVLSSGATGTVTAVIDFQDLPQGIVFQPGETWYFQLWYRDQPSTSNTTAGVEVRFCG